MNALHAESFRAIRPKFIGARRTQREHVCAKFRQTLSGVRREYPDATVLRRKIITRPSMRAVQQRIATTLAEPNIGGGRTEAGDAASDSNAVGDDADSGEEPPPLDILFAALRGLNPQSPVGGLARRQLIARYQSSLLFSGWLK